MRNVPPAVERAPSCAESEQRCVCRARVKGDVWTVSAATAQQALRVLATPAGLTESPPRHGRCSAPAGGNRGSERRKASPQVTGARGLGLSATHRQVVENRRPSLRRAPRGEDREARSGRKLTADLCRELESRRRVRPGGAQRGGLASRGVQQCLEIFLCHREGMSSGL